ISYDDLSKNRRVGLDAPHAAPREGGRCSVHRAVDVHCDCRTLDCLQLVRLQQSAFEQDRQYTRRMRGGVRRMTLLPLFIWLENSGIGRSIRDSTWLFPWIESVHLVALSVLGGAVLIVDLRLLGV